MNAPKERILLVESDPEIIDLIARQTLLPMGFRVEVVGAAATAIQQAARFSPDVIISNLNLPGLSGKDLLVAFSAQSFEVPIIMVAQKGLEGDIIQAFRLGATDFLICPLREAEVLATVERVLKQVRARREREMLARQLNQTNQELQRRVRELTTIFAMGKAVTSITDLHSLFDKIIEGAVYISECETGWLMVRDERTKSFLLSAYRNLPKSIAAHINHPWDDGLSSLVALSGEPLSIHGEPLKRFKISFLGGAALVVPVKVKSEVVGLLVVVRKSTQPFSSSNQALLEAVADYASIAIVNAHLFKVMEERARSSQQIADAALVSERVMDELVHKASWEIGSYLQVLKSNLDTLSGRSSGRLNSEQANVLTFIRESLRGISDVAEAMSAVQTGEEKRRSLTDLNELARQTVTQFQPIAPQNGVTLFVELSPSPLQVEAVPVHIAKVLDGLLSNAIRFSPQGGQVTVRVELTKDKVAHISVQDKGVGMDEKQLARIFEHKRKTDHPVSAGRFTGLGISLPLIRDIVAAYGGKVWADSKPGSGSVFHFTLPVLKSNL